MLYFHVLVLVSLAAYNTHGASVQIPNDVDYFSDSLENVVKKKCLENANQTTRDAAVDALHHFNHCSQILKPGKKVTDEELYDYCLEESTEFSSYFETLINKLTPCLAPEEKYIEQLARDSFEAYNQQWCRSFAVGMSRWVKHDECVQKFDSNPLSVCYKNSPILGNTAALGVITKPKLCQGVAKLQACYEEIFNERCPNSPELGDVLTIVTKRLLELCAH